MTGPDEVSELVAAHGYRPGRVVLVGGGLDNVAYEVDGELIVRFRTEPDPATRAERTEREARVLAAVAQVSPVPVPRPVFAVPGRGCLAYRRLPGVPLLDVPTDQRSARGPAVAATLGGLLTALHAVPVPRMAELVDTDDTPLSEWRDEAAGTYPAIAERVPAAHRPAIEAFLAAPPPPARYTPVFSHNDLGIEHVLVDPADGRVTGVIDWSDAAVVDPAADFGRLHRDLGPAATRAAGAANQRRLLVKHLTEAGIDNAATWLKDIGDATVRVLAARGEAFAAELAEDEP